MEAHVASAYCDVYICVCLEATAHEFQILYIPVHERHTGKIIFNKFAKVMDDIYLYWCNKIIGGYLYCKKKMTGQHQGDIVELSWGYSA